MTEDLALSAQKKEMSAVDYWSQAEELNDELTLHFRDRILLAKAVIARKVCIVRETNAVPRAFEAFASVLQTMRKTNPVGMVAALVKLISSPAPA